MDTSGTYIKMCEKATEIQKSHESWEDGDVWGYIHEDNKVESEYYDDAIAREYLYNMKELTWLPSQSQLQQMVFEQTMSLEYNFKAFVSFLCGHGDSPFTDYATQFSSMEQLWLAFVMEERYNKIWNEKKWVLLPFP